MAFLGSLIVIALISMAATGLILLVGNALLGGLDDA